MGIFWLSEDLFRGQPFILSLGALTEKRGIRTSRAHYFPPTNMGASPYELSRVNDSDIQSELKKIHAPKTPAAAAAAVNDADLQRITDQIAQRLEVPLDAAAQ